MYKQMGKITINNGLNEHSVLPGCAETVVWLKLTSAKIMVMNQNNQVIATHNCLYGDDDQKLLSTTATYCIKIMFTT